MDGVEELNIVHLVRAGMSGKIADVIYYKNILITIISE
jgi:hypothetical protein